MKQYPISRDGWPYLAVLTSITVLLFFIYRWISIIPFLFLLFVAYFFRNPERTISPEPGTFVSPADGVVMDVEKVYEEHFLKCECMRIRIFLSLFNVHVNRTPMNGKVTYVKYREGKMLPAFKSHASELNEKNYVGIENDKVKYLVTQVTGFIARRIVCWVKVGDVLQKGQRFGLIKFGSCTELFLPLEIEILARNGQKVQGGITELGRLR